MTHILRSVVITKQATAGNCPDCGKRTRFLCYTYEWFDPDCTCILCGRSFNADGWVRLPFMRGSREHEIKRAKARFRDAVAIGLEAHLATL